MIYEKNPADKPEHTKKTTPQGSGVVSTILIAAGNDQGISIITISIKALFSCPDSRYILDSFS